MKNTLAKMTVLGLGIVCSTLAQADTCPANTLCFPTTSNYTTSAPQWFVHLTFTRPDGKSQDSDYCINQSGTNTLSPFDIAYLLTYGPNNSKSSPYLQPGKNTISVSMCLDDGTANVCKTTSALPIQIGKTTYNNTFSFTVGGTTASPTVTPLSPTPPAQTQTASIFARPGTLEECMPGSRAYKNTLNYKMGKYKKSRMQYNKRKHHH